MSKQELKVLHFWIKQYETIVVTSATTYKRLRDLAHLSSHASLSQKIIPIQNLNRWSFVKSWHFHLKCIDLSPAFRIESSLTPCWSLGAIWSLWSLRSYLKFCNMVQYKALFHFFLLLTCFATTVETADGRQTQMLLRSLHPRSDKFIYRIGVW